ncbi:MAG TPA: hypothetical protein VNE62_07010 [Actinomycetota bacterium]|nr:hypothetical protein [Actinomycetota bacterium]
MRAYARILVLALVALAAPPVEAASRPPTPSRFTHGDAAPFRGPFGDRIAAAPLQAGEIARAAAAPFAGHPGSAGPQLRAQAQLLGLRPAPPSTPRTTDLAAALRQAAAATGAASDPTATDEANRLSPSLQVAAADVLSATTASLPLRLRAFATLSPSELEAIQQSLARVRPLDQGPTAALIAGATPAGLAPFRARRELLDKIDTQSLLDGAVLVADALDRAKEALLTAHGSDSATTIPTPFGDIVVKGASDDVSDEQAFLLIDQGGNDSYAGRVASATGDPIPLVDYLLGVASGSVGPPDPALITKATQTRLVLDVSGRDTYTSGDEAQGFGSLAGLGILSDAGDGDDTYAARDLAQGAGFIAGVGLLLDEGGANSFAGNFGTQGFSQAGGVGILSGGRGSDIYTSFVFSQGTGFDGGAGGTLADAGGNDRYICTGTVDTAAVILPVDHTRPSTGCHGTAFGGQGMQVDGGGDDVYQVATSFQAMALLGASALVDSGGRDTFEAGEWSHGIAVLGESVLAAGPGNTTYSSVQRVGPWIDQFLGSHGEGYSGGIGVLSDAGGNDSYSASVDKTLHLAQWACSAGCSFAGGVGVLEDSAGNDRYVAEVGEGAGLGGYGALLDGSGDDSYQLTFAESRGQAFGGPEPPVLAGTLALFDCGVGYLVDGAGADSYSNTVTSSGVRGDDRRWNHGDYGRGMDGAQGITSYVAQQAAQDLHAYLRRYACQTPLPRPVPIP